jgi:hypothetical protein
MSSFYELVGSAECWDIHILIIHYFNSFGFLGTPCISQNNNTERHGGTVGFPKQWMTMEYSHDWIVIVTGCTIVMQRRLAQKLRSLKYHAKISKPTRFYNAIPTQSQTIIPLPPPGKCSLCVDEFVYFEIFSWFSWKFWGKWLFL